MAGTTPSTPTRARQVLAHKRALVVQGDVRDRERLVECLSGWGIAVEVTTSPFHGVALLWSALEASRPFHLALFGSSGHSVPGEQFVALVRSEPLLADMPMLYIGGGVGAAEKVSLKQAGFFDTVAMPLDKTWLFDTLHRACGVVSAGLGVARLMDRHTVLGDPMPRLEILLAEPNPEQRRIVHLALERGGHQLFDVDSGEQALEALAKHRFDLVIIALDLPGLGTSDALKLYRFSVARQDWPAFIGLAREPTMSQIRDYAAFGVTLISSPAKPPELLRAITDAVRGDGDTSKVCPSSLVSAAKESSSMTFLDQRVLGEIERLGSHPNFLYELIQEFLTDVGTLLEAVLQTRGTAQCYLRLREFGHVLQDNAGSVGALQLYHLGLVASQYPEELFKNDEGQLLARIESAYRQTRNAFWRYLQERSLSRLPNGAGY